ncbi:hypothetical protein [Arcobacter sp. FWKO B]|uniref:hypothetical protein n=1 Tax=Arcobacter sp. FWKO B TaxID=2593672 RepID=UPI001903AFC5|nr:hypothetical protein [Arcobacter sp. FWKO B]
MRKFKIMPKVKLYLACYKHAKLIHSEFVYNKESEVSYKEQLKKFLILKGVKL